jgi:methionyl-tRNA formyltransferase
VKLILFADNVVGLGITQYLLDSFPEDLSLVVTIEKNEIFYLVNKKNIPVCLSSSIEITRQNLSNGFDLGVLAWWPKIIKKALLQVPRNGFVNTHPSLLPYNRGKHYNFWALVEQAPFGVTLHRVDPGIDTGDIIAQQTIPYDWCDTGESLFFKAQTSMLTLFSQTYPILRAGNFISFPQDKESGSFHHSSEIDQASRIDLDCIYKARDLLNLLRARTFEGHPGCWFEEGGVRYEIGINVRKI